MANTLQAFLKEKYVKVTKSNAEDITHKRIKDEANKIGGGTYIIKGEDLATFYGLVYNEAVVAGNIWTLTERQKGEDRILIDLDFKYAHGTARPWDYDDAWNILQGYMDELKALLDFKPGQKVTAYIMARDAPNHLPDGSLTKDGIHLVINVKLKRKLQIELRKRVMATIEGDNDTEIRGVFQKLPLINELKDVIDESITKGGTDWQIIGCRKSATAGAYKVVKKLVYELDPADREWMMEMTEVPTPCPREIFNDVIATAEQAECGYTREAEKLLNPTAEKKKAKEEEQRLLLETAVPEDIIKLYRCLDTEKRCGAGQHTNWVGVMLATKGAIGEDGKPIFVEWSKTFGTENKGEEAEDAYDQAEARELTAGSLHYWAREDNPELYREYFTKQDKVIKMKTADEQLTYILNNGVTHYQMAKLFKIAHGDVHVCQDRERKIFYNFGAKMMWEKDSGVEIRNKLSGKLVALFNTKHFQLNEELSGLDPADEMDRVIIDKIQHQMAVCKEAVFKLENTNEKNNILSQIADLIHNSKFLDDFNRAKDELPIQPLSVINLQTLEVRPRTIRDKWTYECEAEFIEEMTEEDKKWMDDYFLALFRGRQDTMQTTLDIFKTTLSGRVIRHMFFLLGAKGSNGKSLLIRMLQDTFTGATDTISKKIIVQDNKASSALNTEVEKLEKCRMAFTSEFDKNEKMNIKMIKEVSGGDKVNLRGMRETDRTIQPTSNLFAVTNEMPSMKIKEKKEQSAFFKRLIVIPFNAEFENNTEFEALLKSKKSQFLTYIIKHGTIKEKFNITDEMQTAVEDYAEESTADSFNDFIKAKIETCEYDDTSLATRRETRLDQKTIIEEYNAYCHALGNHPEKNTPTKWHRIIMEKFNLTADQSKESGGKRYYNGLRKRPDVEEEEEDL